MDSGLDERAVRAEDLGLPAVRAGVEAAVVNERVLVVYASRMGSTKEIAEEVGAELAARGLVVDVLTCSSDPDPAGYGAVVIGSAIYVRRWDRSATGYLKRHAPVLAKRPTWLFQSGPCGEGATTEQLDAPRAVARQMRKHGLAKPRTFGGRLEIEHATGPVSRWLGEDGPLSGDFRDWKLIRGWAHDIADELITRRTPRRAP